MTQDRYDALMRDDQLDLTDEEVADGWHFCVDFDLLLLKVGGVDGCTCQRGTGVSP